MMAVQVAHRDGAVVVTAGNTAASGVLSRLVDLVGEVARDGGDVVIDVSDVRDASSEQLAALLRELPGPGEVAARYVLVAATPSLWQQAVAVTQRFGVGVAGSVDDALAALAGAPLVPRPRELRGA